MQYAAHLPNTRSMVAPVLALAIGAAGATGIYAAIDDSGGSAQPSPIVVKVAATVARPSTVSTSPGKDESSTAAAVGSSSAGPDEASVASAIGGAH